MGPIYARVPLFSNEKEVAVDLRMGKTNHPRSILHSPHLWLPLQVISMQKTKLLLGDGFLLVISEKIGGKLESLENAAKLTG